MIDYKPGTVAEARIPDYSKGREENAEWPTQQARVSRYDGGWALLDDPDIFWPDHRNEVTNIRPLIVLDLEDPAAVVEYLKVATDGFDKAAYGMDAWSGRAPLRKVAAQIEEQMKPPRIEEPGLWGVVEARLTGYNDRTRFVHHDMADRNAADWHETGGGWWSWDDLVDPVLIREGV